MIQLMTPTKGLEEYIACKFIMEQKLVDGSGNDCKATSEVNKYHQCKEVTISRGDQGKEHFQTSTINSRVGIS